MVTYLILVAWIAGSDSAGGVDTKVNSPFDLREEYLAGNENILAGSFSSPEPLDEDSIRRMVYSLAFEYGFSIQDSASICMVIPPDFIHPKNSSLGNIENTN